MVLFHSTYGAPTDLNTSEALTAKTTPTPSVIEIREEIPKDTNLEQIAILDSGNNLFEALTTKTTPTPPVIDIIEEIPKDIHFEQIAILEGGNHLSEALTAKIVGPVLIFNSKVAAAAGALPPLLATKGAIIGSMIATPIQIGAAASSSIASGVTGKLVAVPISIASGAAAKFMSAAQNGEQIWNFNLEHGGEILKDGLIKMGHIVLKPIAVIVGAQTALTGVGLGVTGTGIKGVGVGMEAVGAKMIATGLTAKGIGHILIKSQFVP